MGLKTQNYEVKRLGIILPEAYAIVKDITVRGLAGFAIFAVQSTRENAEKALRGEMTPIEEVRVDFIVNRESNDRAVAYAEAKAQKQSKKYNPVLGIQEDVVVNMPFYGWQDDIVDSEG